MQKATFGAGCFWHIEATFRKVKGVLDTSVGFMGGSLERPSYNDVCGGTTGHAEVMQIKFEPSKVSYKKLLEIFWKVHNPTTLNRQGLNIGTQYRSVIFYHNEQQKEEAIKSKEKFQKNLKNEIVTEIKKVKEFYKAEEYHQRYLEKKKNNPIFKLFNKLKS